MIRRSTVIATAAILLSLLVHFLGLSFTARVQPEQPEEDATTDVVALGNTFEDVAENLSEPVAPEKTPSPEPQTETATEPDFADTPTSEALVASPEPQRTASPDTGSARVVQPETTGPSEPEEGRVAKPATVEPSGGDEGTAVDVTVTPPVGPETVAQVPKGNPEARVEPVEAVTAEPVLGLPVTPAPIPDAPQRIAALPVAPTPELSAVPVILLERETVASETPETTKTTVVPTPEDPQTVKAEDEPGGSDLAVTASPRPRISKRRQAAEPTGLRDGSTEFSELLYPPLIESPLTAYLRGQTDLVVRQNSRARSGGLGFLDSRGPGNSDVTNYAGQVLVYLNRAPVARLTARGSARVMFEINADGTLARVDILDSTGSREIDRAAKAQVRSAAPFPPPPQGVSRRLTFVYRSN
jgi:periplasmic protein TonB